MKFCFLILLCSLVTQGYSSQCKVGEVLCEGTANECIPESYVCDGIYKDCSNTWDETDCLCDFGRIQCPNSTLCIWESDKCDYESDCPGGSDEVGCPPCPEFTCDDGNCIPQKYVCDGDLDCKDGEDEGPHCPPCKGFTCDDGRCIPERYVCDGYLDCHGGEDERQDCAPCEHFTCDDGSCIPDDYICDKYEDCSHGEDERQNCTCDGFQCLNGKCIIKYWYCDGDNDCGDNSDETNCMNLTRPLKVIPFVKPRSIGNHGVMTRQIQKQIQKKAASAGAGKQRPPLNFKKVRSVRGRRVKI